MKAETSLLTGGADGKRRTGNNGSGGNTGGARESGGKTTPRVGGDPGSRRCLALLLCSSDSVVNAITDIGKGDPVTVLPGGRETITAAERIPFGFKMARKDIGKGEPILKYGETIGLSSRAIGKGSLVHIHNVEGVRGRGDKAVDTAHRNVPGASTGHGAKKR